MPINPTGRPRTQWPGKFGGFVTKYTIESLSTDLDVDPTTVYGWLRGEFSPTPANAIAIAAIARRAGSKLTLEDIYVREVKQHDEEQRIEKSKALSPP